MKIALAGDTMLGRMVAERLATAPPASLVADEVVAVAREADLFLLNLECAISDRGERWPDPAKPFFFRGPPAAVTTLHHLGVGCVTLGNNHALDYGEVALRDTLAHLAAAGIAVVGAGVDEAAAREPALLEVAGGRVGVVGLTDHPHDFAAGPDRPGVAYADLRRGVPAWPLDAIAEVRRRGADVVVVTPHWGPNMVPEPVGHVRAAAAAFRRAGADVVAGHSAHVFHGVDLAGEGVVLHDLGDFLDDYAVDPVLRNDRGLLFLVDVELADGRASVTRVEAVPLALDFCRTRLASADEAGWIARRFRDACAAMGSEVEEVDGRLVIDVADHAR